MLISQTRGNPFERPVIAPAGFAGTLEASIGLFTRWFEASVLARGGNGRVAALEAGVRPGVDWLTLLVSYGFDVVQVSDLVIGGNEVLLGHGPRLMVDVAFDVRQPRLGIDPPKRSGPFSRSARRGCRLRTRRPTGPDRSKRGCGGESSDPKVRRQRAPVSSFQRRFMSASNCVRFTSEVAATCHSWLKLVPIGVGSSLPNTQCTCAR